MFTLNSLQKPTAVYRNQLLMRPGNRESGRRKEEEREQENGENREQGEPCVNFLLVFQDISFDSEKHKESIAV